ncbi:MAG: ATP synthase F1 subunit delta [Patescibacteria group bacterium]
MQKISHKKYAVILHRLLSDVPDHDVPAALKAFVSLVARHKALSKFDRIVRAYQHYADQQAGITEVTVTSASALDHKDTRVIADDLKKEFGEQVRIKHETDPTMIGGIKLSYGDTIVDGSVRQRLQELAYILSK